ncbi:helix-turn-helix transcriptional regulator [Marinomonas sp.]|nr:helix-turn-helix transcriptional regulator [Marinomonas sp.]MDB4836951.1 helix-turn-helix transcriptional regulator [Marinomonas sp.]
MAHTSSNKMTRYEEKNSIKQNWRGDSWLYTLKSGVKIRGAHTQYVCDVDNSAEIPPQITFIFLLKGDMTLILRRKKYLFSAGEHGCCIMMSSTETEVLRRLANMGEINNHIVLTGMEQWLEDDVISSEARSDLYNERMRSWPMTVAMREGCEKWMSLDRTLGTLQRDVLGLSLLNLTWEYYLWLSDRKSLTVDNVDYQKLELVQSLDVLMRRGVFDTQGFADALNMSLRTLQRRAKEQLGCTLKDWITHQRLLLAKNALLEQDISISEAAWLAGYQHNSSFILAFRKVFKVTPKIYLSLQKVKH